MLLGTDELTILRGSSFYGTWQWINSVSGNPESFAGLSASIKIKNIHEDFTDVKNTYEIGTVIVEPLDANNNVIPGRVDISLSKEETLYFAIPDFEDDRYGESDFYSVLNITLSTGEVILQAKVRVVDSLEAETLNFLLDEKDEAIIINSKLDNILARNNEFIATRDNLIDVVIPTSLLTYNTNHNEKMDIYNANHTDKLDTYNSNDTSKTNIYNQNHATKLQEVNTLALEVQSNKDLVDQSKANVLAMKDDVQGNKESVALMKTAIEAMLDNFDDRYLGQFDADPLLDNDGNALVIGTIYYNKIAKELRFYNGVSWDSPVAAAQTYALQASQYASNALASKNASKLSEDNAKLSEQNTQALANQVANNYEPKNANIQSHISNSSNPHGTTASQVGAYSKAESDTKYNLKIDIANIIDNLTSTLATQPLSANQGRILKGYIDNLTTLLTSNDTNLDTLQEIVSFIKLNKTTLDSLGISNIAGLVDALNAKANTADVYTKTSIDSLIDIHSKTAKTTLADVDEFMTADSTSSWSLKKITWASIKTLLVNLFISKVTSTDNAIVRFNGTTGEVQNSGVVIDDNNNVGIGLTNPTLTGSADKAVHIHANTESQIHLTNTTTGNTSSDGSVVSVANNSNLYLFNKENASTIIGTNNIERVIIDTAGNVGIGVTPSAWYGAIKAIDTGDSSAFYGYNNSSAKGYGIASNAYRNNSGNYIYKNTEKVAIMESYNGATYWFTAPSGTAGTAATLTTAMTLDDSSLNVYRARFNSITNTSTSDETYLLANINPLGASVGLLVYNGASSATPNTAVSIVKIGKTLNNRSINAAGTINASGADYAEYEYSNDITILKGQIVGFKEDGTLTDKYSESIRFAIKSTNPSMVGGDVWGCEEIVGKRPDKPIRKLDITKQKLISDVVMGDDGTILEDAVYETVIIEKGDSDKEWELIYSTYEKDLADFENRLEIERQKVDRIAYAGKVPVNVYEAKAGQYIIASNKDDLIVGIAVDSPTFEQYLKCVGRVNKILDDGRTEVAVIIH